jgi:hypothetical protein
MRGGGEEKQIGGGWNSYIDSYRSTMRFYYRLHNHRHKEAT